jgi:hypothetical protein
LVYFFPFWFVVPRKNLATLLQVGDIGEIINENGGIFVVKGTDKKKIL